jgi:hypothetical protein
MAKLVEVTVARPHLGKTNEFLELCAKFKKKVLAAGVEEVWFNTGNVGRHFGCVIAYQVFASGESNGKINDQLNNDAEFGADIQKMSSLCEWISHDSYYQTSI